MLNDSKYSRWYWDIIHNAQIRISPVISESHHIIPASCGGTNESSNMVDLTPKEHFVCHHLLTKCMQSVQHRKKMQKAFWYYCQHPLKRNKITARVYSSAKTMLIESMIGHEVSQVTRQKISKALKGKDNGWTGRKHSNESKRKMSESAKIRPMSSMTEETKAKISKANKGRKWSPELIQKRTGEKRSDEARRKMSEAHMGKKISEEQKKKQSLALKGRKFSPEHLAKLKAAAQQRALKNSRIFGI